MRASLLALCAIVTAAAGAVVPRDSVTTVYVTAPCESKSATVFPLLTSSTQSSTALSTPSSVASTTSLVENVKLAPVSDPSSDPSDLNNIVPKSNLTLHYGSNDTSTPDSNAQISLQMKVPSVVLEEILSVRAVVCSDSGVAVTFNDLDGYKKSMKEWPTSGDFVLFTNHLGNCDVDFERGIFLVGGLTFDDTTLTVVATAEKSDLQSTAGSMQIDFGQMLGSAPRNSTTGPYSNTTAISSREIHWDPTYSLKLNTALPANTVIASLDPYVEVVANTASFTSSATFKGHLDYNFWRFKVDKLYFDLDVAFDATLALTSSIRGSYSHNLQYAPSSLSVAPITIPGILTLGPALDFAIGAQISADADVHVSTLTEVALQDGNVHVDLLQEANSGTSGWTPRSSASASLDVEAVVQVNPYVQLGVEMAIDFMGGLLDLSSGIKANATLANELNGNVVVDAEIGSGASEAVTISGGSGDGSGNCEKGVRFKSDFIFGITGYVGQLYSKELYAVEVPVFDNCWALAGS